MAPVHYHYCSEILLLCSRARDPNNFPIYFQELFTLSLKLMGFFLWISTKNESFLSDICLFLDSLFDALPRRLESTTDCSFCFGILAVVTVEGERAEAYIIITHVLLFEIVILTLAINGPAVIWAHEHEHESVHFLQPFGELMSGVAQKHSEEFQRSRWKKTKSEVTWAWGGWKTTRR